MSARLSVGPSVSCSIIYHQGSHNINRWKKTIKDLEKARNSAYMTSSLYDILFGCTKDVVSRCSDIRREGRGIGGRISQTLCVSWNFTPNTSFFSSKTAALKNVQKFNIDEMPLWWRNSANTGKLLKALQNARRKYFFK